MRKPSLVILHLHRLDGGDLMVRWTRLSSWQTAEGGSVVWIGDHAVTPIAVSETPQQILGLIVALDPPDEPEI